MIKKRIFYMAGCLATGISIVAVLYFLSEKASTNPNGFIRKFPSHQAVGRRFMDIGSTAWRIAGFSNGELYLSNSVSPNMLLVIDSATRIKRTVRIKTPASLVTSKAPLLQIDADRLYVMDGQKNMILQSGQFIHTLSRKDPAPNFTACVPVTGSSFVLRSLGRDTANVLVKYDIKKKEAFMAPKLLQRQVDGIFSTDGVIIKVPEKPQIVYVYYYRNQFVSADTNLNLLYRGKTIDTVSFAKMKIAVNKNAKQLTMISPPIRVNKQAAANSRFLFVHSGLKADNEVDEQFKTSSVIDIYRLDNGKYVRSIHLPNLKGHFIRDFKVFDNLLYALYDRYLYSYRLNGIEN